ncbi:5-formyltetrahydrofolate cyclo-ligase [Salinimonas marina]|uniref:5-formyltetrahydrofolate cyclo-ligase n=1 Tax=Salinimonas marina TaxID=2785918 RepID=A0A7S9HDJ1_9ALTE|nr:5-formyltetrahydrofolate cyclo-ligase [Salinimonas marina]QPG06321.1 5-formyltetrahydrofolate cyclo-ligase [Salinimonas marina]
MPAQPNRRELRQTLRAARNALTSAAQHDAAQAIAYHLTCLEAYTRAHTIAGYLANDGEPDLTPMLSQCWRDNKHTTLPVLHPFSKQHLLFLRYCSATAMTTNRFNIAEPILSCADIQLLNQHDMILMPLVGFDKKGNRLGMGGGFYDRSLAALPAGDKRPVLVGIAHDCQQVDALPVASWDIPCDVIVTPAGVHNQKYTQSQQSSPQMV